MVQPVFCIVDAGSCQINNGLNLVKGQETNSGTQCDERQSSSSKTIPALRKNVRQMYVKLQDILDK